MNYTNNKIYLDNAATSFPKPESVYESMNSFYRQYGANPGRSGHRMGMIASRALEDVRILLHNFFHAEIPEKVIFTFNATDALNMALRGFLKEGDEVIATILDHNSLTRPLNYLAKERHVQIKRLEPISGEITVDEIRKHISKRTRLVALTHASNVTGWIQPVEEIGQYIRKNTEAFFLVDAAQTAGILPIDLKKMTMDFFIFTGHKSLYGPMGTGGLILSSRANIEPYRSGGSGVESEDEYQPKEMPFKLEAGTENLPGIVWLGEGIKFIQSIGMDNILKGERGLKTLLIEELKKIKRVKLYSGFNLEKELGIVSFNIEGLSSSEVATIMDSEFGIAVRAGLHCAPLIHKFLGTFPEGTVRISLGYFNTEEEIVETIFAIKSIAKST